MAQVSKYPVSNVPAIAGSSEKEIFATKSE
jgi:hypothetical protein